MVYFIGVNSIRNNAKSEANAAQLHWLKSTYGDNWEKGVANDPTVERYDPDRASRNQAVQEQKKKEGYRDVIKESVGELAAKRTISGKQAQRLANIADQQ